MKLRRLTRFARLATLPETRGLIMAVAQSDGLRGARYQLLHDRPALGRRLRRPITRRELLRRTASHPAVQELASAGLLLLPGRYLPLGWAASWATRRFLRQSGRQPSNLQPEMPVSPKVT